MVDNIVFFCVAAGVMENVFGLMDGLKKALRDNATGLQSIFAHNRYGGWALVNNADEKKCLAAVCDMLRLGQA